MNEQGAAKKATVTTLGEREIRIERVFDAPRERVFAAHTDPELVAQWWGRRMTAAVIDELDATSGGKWRFVERNEDGSETAFRGVFREVTAPERIVQTFEWEGMPGHVSVDDARFEDLGDGRTKIVSITTFHTGEERDGMIDAGMEKGLNEGYEQLDELLAP
jgi:uncharacterized protein YndB with AHSA1/START domain